MSIARHGPWNQVPRFTAVVAVAACARPPIAQEASDAMPELIARAIAESTAETTLLVMPAKSGALSVAMAQWADWPKLKNHWMSAGPKPMTTAESAETITAVRPREEPW